MSDCLFLTLGKKLTRELGEGKANEYLVRLPWSPTPHGVKVKHGDFTDFALNDQGSQSYA